MSGTTIYTTSHYTAVWTNYCWIYGCADYKTADYTTYVRVTSDWVGEAWTEGPGTYTENASSTTTVTVNGTTCTTGTLSSARTQTIAEGVWTYVKAGGSSSNYVDVAKGTSAKSVNLVLTYTIRGSSYTKTVPISIPALASYTITYNANGGTGTMSASTKYYGTAITLRDNAFRKEGYTFQGWATSANGSIAYANKASYTSNSGATLYAQWKKDITLTYNANTGSGAPSSETKTVWNSTTSATFTVPSQVPTKQYYKFSKWTTEQGGGGDSYYPNTQYSFSVSKTLYAQWVEDYIPPQIPNNPTVYRTDSTGTDNNGIGSYGLLTFEWTNGSLSGAEYTSTVTASYREHGTSTWTTITNESTTPKTFYSVFGGNLAADKQYDVQIVLQDTGFPANTYTAYISTENFTIDVNANGTSIGLMMVAPDTDDGVIAPDYNLYINTSATSGADYAIVQALTSLGWEDIL